MTGRRLSCVIPAHNAERTVGAALRSVLRQTEPVAEVIVVDDGSTDGTVDVVAGIGDSRIRLISQANAGSAAARNAGVAAASGDCLGFLDSDDLWLPSYVQRAVVALEASANPGFAFTDAWVFRPGSGRVRRSTAMAVPSSLPDDRESFLVALLRRNFVFVSATVPASVLATVGGFDERLRGSEDYDLWLRIVLAGFEPVWMGGPLALYRQHRDQMSRSIVAMKRATADAYRGLSADAMPSETVRQVLLDRREAAQRELAIESGQAGLATTMRRLRHAIGMIRSCLGLTAHRFSRRPPAAIVAAFGDLRSLDESSAASRQQ